MSSEQSEEEECYCIVCLILFFTVVIIVNHLYFGAYLRIAPSYGSAVYYDRSREPNGTETIIFTSATVIYCTKLSFEIVGLKVFIVRASYFLLVSKYYHLNSNLFYCVQYIYLKTCWANINVRLPYFL